MSRPCLKLVGGRNGGRRCCEGLSYRGVGSGAGAYTCTHVSTVRVGVCDGLEGGVHDAEGARVHEGVR